jgi:predicted ribonuclease YlaK
MALNPSDSPSLKYVYPDTNVLLHFPAFDGLDWRSLCDADQVVIRIAQPVLAELNTIKDGGRSRTKAIRKRAETVLRRLKTLLREQGTETNLTANVRLVMEPHSAPIALEAGLQPTAPDDMLISQIISFKKNDRIRSHPGH